MARRLLLPLLSDSSKEDVSRDTLRRVVTATVVDTMIGRLGADFAAAASLRLWKKGIKEAGACGPSKTLRRSDTLELLDPDELPEPSVVSDLLMALDLACLLFAFWSTVETLTSSVCDESIGCVNLVRGRADFVGVWMSRVSEIPSWLSGKKP